MAQAPATPKSQRILRRLYATTLGPRWTYEHCDLQPSEQEALERRVNGRPGPISDPTVVFLLPLVGRHHVNEWHEVEARLADTVASFRRQTSDRWMAVICGQDEPAGIAFDDQIRFLPFTRRVDGNDKWAKLEMLCHHLPKLGVTSGYAMSFDADDLLNRRTVEEMVRRRDPYGYLVTRGLVMDAQSRQLGLCAPQTPFAPGRKPFWKMCGSCAAFRFDLSAEPHRDAEFLGAITAHEHRMFPYLAALAGRPLRPLRQEAAMYIVNHGENFGVRRGRVAFKTRYVGRFPVTDETTLARIQEDFPMVGKIRDDASPAPCAASHDSS
ncbi:hypothetical protein [Tropicimonas isoalkanivorans]|uniref:Glycosyl transferase family 2 n=1 Tax=Tropicimonas isoalkanivorans TaxID=441112 RepID=A0A1I1NW17_9RHOB|nr:hypothetical protein [Tropicimonas isoalkanivorans]SFC98933.1 hypothetical protein SAMN04488094_112157 [Tropicimonas isoalkanivorans]